jgi:hypothetical protein
MMNNLLQASYRFYGNGGNDMNDLVKARKESE